MKPKILEGVILPVVAGLALTTTEVVSSPDRPLTDTAQARGVLRMRLEELTPALDQLLAGAHGYVKDTGSAR